MRPARATLALTLAAMLVLPLAPARADDGDTSDSRVGVVLAAVCGYSLKLSVVAPVPWAGVAALSCLMGFLDAAFTPDAPAPTPPAPPPPTP